MPCGVMEIAQSLPGVMQTMVVTVRQFEISSRVCSRFKPQTRAFAAILEDGSVVTWGHASHGGDSSAVRDQLKGVQQIQATGKAFAAILEDGSVVTWGASADCGGDSSAVQDQLRGVQQIQATHLLPLLRFWKMDPARAHRLGCDSARDYGAMAVTVRQFEISSGVCSRFKPLLNAFAAILEDGSVVTWGDADYGGDSSAVQDQLTGVQQIQATVWCLCCNSGRWICRYLGSCSYGGDSSAVRDQLKGVLQIQATDGCLCCNSGRWICRDLGPMQTMVVTVRQFEISSGVYSRFKPLGLGPLLRFWTDGSVVTWGLADVWR